MIGRVAEKDVLLVGRRALAGVAEMAKENGEALWRLGMVACRMEARERRVRQDVDRTISANSSSEATPGRARPSR